MICTRQWKACRWARSCRPGSRRRSRSISRDADSAASALDSSAASVMPSRLRSTPLAGSRYGSLAARLTCGNGTGPAPAVHRWTAVRPLPRRTAPDPPHRVPAPRPVPRPAPRQPRAAVPRPPAALRTATDTSTASALRWAPTKTAASRDRRTWSSTPASPARNSRNGKTCGTATAQACAIAYAYPRRTGLTEPASCRC
jgi:hypothetical protein